MVYFWLIFGVLPQFLAQKSGVGSGGVKIFIPNLNHLLVLAYPENLSPIGLMVKAVDTFCAMGTGRDRDGDGDGDGDGEAEGGGKGGKGKGTGTGTG